MTAEPTLTLAALAADKGLTEEYLRGWGLAENRGAVLIPYLRRDGTPAATRIRTHAAAGQGSRWRRGDRPIPYGLHRLNGAGTLVLVEGESDVWTLHAHDFPVLGLPGADMAGKLEADHLAGVDELFLVMEPDAAGRNFVRGIWERLQRLGWNGPCRVIDMARTGSKDPNDLFRRDPAAFRATFETALREAKPVDAVLRGLDSDENTTTANDDHGIPTIEAWPYEGGPKGIFRLRSSGDTIEREPLSNFMARIVGEITYDDGKESVKHYELEVSHRGRTVRFSVPAQRFATLDWIHEHLGATAYVMAGFGRKDHARAAIQMFSRNVSPKTVYTHTGWRRHDGQWLYLHAGGATGPAGPREDVAVELPAGFEGFDLSGQGGDIPLADALQASLRLLEVAPIRVTLPAFAAIWRAIIGGADFGLHLEGVTGSGKTELAALIQQHFGRELDARHLPGSWASTENALEMMAFTLKDSLFVVDDFAPGGSGRDVQRFHRKADRLFRSQGNLSGRTRLNADATLKMTKPPRGLVFSTGEEIPRGHSIRARLVICSLGRHDMNWERLNRCQQEAAAGGYSILTARFIQWLALHKEEIHRQHRDLALRLRAEFSELAAHRRTPTILADLAAALRIFLCFADESGILPKNEIDGIWTYWRKVLLDMVRQQGEFQGAEDPVLYFRDLLQSALVSGKAHLAGLDGRAPENPVDWGWWPEPNELTIGDGRWIPKGDRIGWVKDNNVYLEPGSAYNVAQKMAAAGRSDAIPISQKTMSARLKEKGFLAQVSPGRGAKVQRVLDGRKRDVWFMDPAFWGPSLDGAATSASEESSPFDHVENEETGAMLRLADSPPHPESESSPPANLAAPLSGDDSAPASDKSMENHDLRPQVADLAEDGGDSTRLERLAESADKNELAELIRVAGEDPEKAEECRVLTQIYQRRYGDEKDE